MPRQKVRATLIVCAIVTLFTAGVTCGTLISPASAQPNADAQLRQLLKDRVAVRKQIVQVFTKLKSTGGSSNVEVLVATRDMLWAELDTCTNKADRIAMLERIVEHEKKITAFFERTPDFQEVERLLLRVRLLDSQITLDREKLG